jgi:hypothetical protein
MAVIFHVLKEELERLQETESGYSKAIADMPRGTPRILKRRINKEKAEKDRLTAQGMFQFIQADPKRVERLHKIFGEQSKGWQKTIRKALKNSGLELPK